MELKEKNIRQLSEGWVGEEVSGRERGNDGLRRKENSNINQNPVIKPNISKAF